MYNLLISLAAAGLVYLGLAQLLPSPWMAVGGAFLAAAGSFFFLARRTNRQLEARVKQGWGPGSPTRPSACWRTPRSSWGAGSS